MRWFARHPAGVPTECIAARRSAPCRRGPGQGWALDPKQDWRDTCFTQQDWRDTCFTQQDPRDTCFTQQDWRDTCFTQQDWRDTCFTQQDWRDTCFTQQGRRYTCLRHGGDKHTVPETHLFLAVGVLSTVREQSRPIYDCSFLSLLLRTLSTSPQQVQHATSFRHVRDAVPSTHPSTAVTPDNISAGCLSGTAGPVCRAPVVVESVAWAGRGFGGLYWVGIGARVADPRRPGAVRPFQLMPRRSRADGGSTSGPWRRPACSWCKRRRQPERGKGQPRSRRVEVAIACAEWL
jgi:hypothetical protein